MTTATIVHRDIKPALVLVGVVLLVAAILLRLGLGLGVGRPTRVTTGASQAADGGTDAGP